ncbi:hypothetical protein [Sphingobium boeckii]|uniref:Uncharacterized protein n=1 Tax=Sphingobium boeckii TaxID=1082345 RepID=A0A7W9EDW1_9SPHN|nr:hypothetical protein [Sphingobium boeckii]MBB5685532.1 hypothetical protein [Sphingobium boeckii]
MSERDQKDAEAGSTRRRALMLGAVAASAVVSIRPALAQTAGSVLNCQIPVPDAGRASNYITAEGKLVPPNTPGAFPPSPRPFAGEQVKAALRGRSLPGADPQRSQAYTNYIRRLQIGQSGFTCYASLQNPRR